MPVTDTGRRRIHSGARGNVARFAEEVGMPLTVSFNSRVPPCARHGRRAFVSLAALAALAFGACATAQTAVSPPGRLLASNCFQCHGTNGKGPGFDRLAGKSASELYSELREFQAGKEGQGIMARHAMGYTDAQLRSLSQWLSTQR